MPTYNAVAYLSHAMNSILSQTYSNFELIVLNDGSTDQTDEVIRAFTDTRIRYINNQSNLGIVATLNKGLAAAQGQYIARMDADDISTPVRFEHQIKYLENHPLVGVLGSAIQIIDRRGNYLHTGFFPTGDALIRWSLMFSNPIAHPTVMMRRESILSCNGYQDVPAEDHDLWERLSHFTSFANLPEVLLSLRRFSGTKTEKNTDTLIESSAKISHRMMLKILGDDVPVNLVEKLWGKGLESSQDALEIADLITQLFFKHSDSLSDELKRLLQRDAARRLVKIATRKNVGNIARLQILQQALRFDPLILVTVTTKKISRVLLTRPHPGEL